MNICYFIQQLSGCGGTERVLTQKANYLINHFGFAVTIVTINDGKPPYFKLDRRIKLINLQLDFLVDAPLKKRFYAYRFNNELFRTSLQSVVDTHKFDICVCFEYGPHFLYVSSLKDKSIKIAELHGSIQEKYFHWERAKKFEKLATLNRYVRWLISAKKYRKFIVLTEKDGQKWRRWLKNVEIIGNPSAISFDQPSPTTAKVVIAVGRLSFEKGFDMLLRSWVDVSVKYPEWILKIYGEGNERENLEEFIRLNSLDRCVKLMGANSDMRQAYQDASLQVFTSRYEGYPLALVEGTCAGLPIISFDCDFGPSEIISDGVTGWLVEPGNISSLTRRLLQLMGDSETRKTMSQNAFASRAKFDIKNIMLKWDALFSSVAQQDNN